MDFLDFLQSGIGLTIVCIAVPAILLVIYIMAQNHKDKLDRQQAELEEQNDFEEVE